MPSNTTYNPPNIVSFVKSALNYDAIGITGIAIAGSTTSIDHVISDDMLLTGAQVLTNSATFGDSLTFQLVDVNNILGYGTNVILNQFVTNWQLRSDTQEQIHLQINYPAKIISGLYLRLKYISIGTTNVSVGINYELHKVLS